MVPDYDEKESFIARNSGTSKSLWKSDYGEGLKRFPGIFGGVFDDYARRGKYWIDDLTTGAITRKTLSAALMMFLATFCSTIALGASIARQTDSHIGISEYLMMNGFAGMAHSLFGCQPLLILRPTGPITLMTGQIFTLAGDINVDFLPLLAWTGIGIGIWMTVIAAFEVSRHIAMLTRFAHDVFAFFVSSIYVVDGIVGVCGRFSGPHNAAAALFALTISVWLVVFASVLSSLRHASHLLSKPFRLLLADYALSLATFTATCLSYAYMGSIEVERLEVTSTSKWWTNPEPTLTGRSWPVPLFSTDSAGVVAITGIAISIPITLFFYFDQNFSSLLCQVPEMQLSKGSYYHSSFLWMGIFNFFCPMFGFPFVTGSLPHSPQMVTALRSDDDSGLHIGPKVKENRISPFLVYFLILMSYLAFSQVIELIPTAAADAVLIFVGLEGICSTELWARLPCLVTPDADCPENIGDPSAARRFTLLQLAVIGAGWGLNFTPAALAFPLVIATLVPIRVYLFPMLFTEKELAILDGDAHKVKVDSDLLSDVDEDLEEEVI
mmetsp:Transcript_8185/g.15189  ORF Transcript_8185/g.15189 Transcript_8185/m.15189 type:complete len:553 (+) Transcript_8185:118-1776(+)|eukprot:CAMPEP_0197519794 /NCGR_PEP_ID=MMETSP1318-20131121/5071_1 /TAXON_ID=552666 /ORGANISM="Partenskyella glossopodia, Strain RCC365" /LENGTH=552 /DNA_ID=CAMNT_0043070977 /DNA_START=26 /DNA_END=1684 /DNA_ORIENTATION=+